MPALEFVIPGNLTTATGGYGYDRQIVAGLSALGWRVRIRHLPDNFPFPDQATLDAAARLLAAIPVGSLVVVDGLALGAMPAQTEAHTARLRLVGLVHHPLALETGLSPADARRLFESERRALAAVHRVVVTSPATAVALGDYGVARARIGVVEPGTAPQDKAPGSCGDTLTLLCVAAVVPRKGHDVLLDALHDLRKRRWRLTCVGSLERSPRTVAALRQKLGMLGLEHRVVFSGELDEAHLARCYAGADLFVLPSYYEGYGMALAEALAHGLPVVSTRAGAIPHTVPAEAALLVRPGDSRALARALAQLMDSAALRGRLSGAAYRAAAALPSWRDATAQFARELKRALHP